MYKNCTNVHSPPPSIKVYPLFLVSQIRRKISVSKIGIFFCVGMREAQPTDLSIASPQMHFFCISKWKDFPQKSQLLLKNGPEESYLQLSGTKLPTNQRRIACTNQSRIACTNQRRISHTSQRGNALSNQRRNAHINQKEKCRH